MPAQTKGGERASFLARLHKMQNVTLVTAYFDAQHKLGYHLDNSNRVTANPAYRGNEAKAAGRYGLRAETLRVEMARRGLLDADGKVLSIFTDRGTD